MLVRDIDTKIIFPDKKCYNASIIKWQGEIILFYRLQNGEKTDTSEIRAVRLDDNFKIIHKTDKSIKIEKISPNNSVDDPRAFIFSNSLYLSFSLHDGLSLSTANGFCKLDNNQNPEKIIYFDYKNNTKNLKRIKKREECLKYKFDWEKNWQFFEKNGELFFVYSISPHVVARVSLEEEKIKKEYKTRGDAFWEFGEMRGGTPPILVGNEYFSFFHSLYNKNKQRIYCMGAYSFEAKPPFRTTKISETPLIDGPVVFPCGAIFENNNWIISYGHNDESIRLLEISHDEMVQKMRKIKTSVNIKRQIYKFQNFIDFAIGKIGIAIKKISPSAYFFIKNLIIK